MKTLLLRCLILLVVALGAAEAQAVPVPVCTPTVTSGVAPLGVVVDCSATTGTAAPFTDYLYRHNFGDPSSGTWANGANTSASKNFATGPIVGHVYENPGTYIITHRVIDGTSSATVTNTITVTDPNTIYAGAATVCFTNGSDFTGCPSGATQTGSSSDFDAAFASCMGTTKRCLLRRGGDVFAASATSNFTSAGPATLGAYGSGALPIINVAAAVTAINLGNAAVNDVRFMDLDIRGTGAPGTDACIGLSANASGVTILRVTCTDGGGGGISLGAGSPGTYVGITGSIVQDSTVTLNHAGVGLFARMSTSALLGNLIGPVAENEHSVRVQRVRYSAIAHNTVLDPAATKTALTIRADVFATDAEKSLKFVVSDNKILQGTRATSLLAFEPSDPTQDDRIEDCLAERNWLATQAYTGANTVVAIKVDAVRCTIRNNLIDLSGPTTAARRGVVVQKTGPTVQPDANNIYNNTLYSSATATTNGIVIAAGVTNTVIKNDFCYFPGGTACIANSGTGTVTATNTSDIGSITTDPLFDGPLTAPIDFRIGTTSYGATGGTAIWPASNDDFFHCDDTTANEHIGAFVPRARTRCSGTAGP